MADDTFADRAAAVSRTADKAIRSTQDAAHAALDGLADSARGLQRDAAPRVDRAAAEAGAVAHRAIDAVEGAMHQLRERAHHASDGAVGYIRAEPIRAVLIAAGAGALLMGILWFASSHRHRR